MSTSYLVKTTGKISSEYTPDEIAISFAGIFEVSCEKAREFIYSTRTVNDNLSKAAVTKYARKLTEIGLIVEIINQGSGETFSQNSEPVHSESTDALMYVCPKCSEKQIKTEECNSCGIIFSKYLAAKAKPEPLESTSPESNGSKEWTESFSLIEFIYLQKKLLSIGLFCAAIIYVFNVLANFDSKDSEIKINSLATYSSDVEQLLNVSNIRVPLNSTLKQLKLLVDSEFETTAKKRGATSESTDRTMAYIDKVVHERAAVVAMGNWIDSALSKNEIAEITALHQDPIIRQAHEKRIALNKESSDYKDFVISLKAKPLSKQRTQAINRLMNVSGYSLLKESTRKANRRVFIELAGLSSSYFVLQTSQNESNREYSSYINSNFNEVSIRNESFEEFAWMHKNYNIYELGDLAASYDKAPLRRFNRVIRTGIDEYYRRVITWVTKQNMRNPD